MSFLSKILGLSTVSMAACMVVCAADAVSAQGRAGYANVITSGLGAGANNAATVSRMPSMPTVSINTTGNLSVGLSVPVKPVPGPIPGPTPGPTPGPQPDPQPEPTPVPDTPTCPYDYTVEQCMNDISACINNGALPNGLNDMFDENVRNGIINGMGLCLNQVEYCIAHVGIDCKKLYYTNQDVWVDFNSRRVQPEYYNFVLRKTGLTPNQAENTCLLLDRNTYGSSFNAVDTDGRTTAEYNKEINKYNNNYVGTDKSNPLGADVDATGNDAKRGHYARWDATNATCLVRVAAYNKDTHITDNLLFGAVGDGKPAEVWKATGDTFKCDKNLFGFSLMKQSETAAIIALPGGAILGTAVGAGVGAGLGDENPCERKEFRKDLYEKIQSNPRIASDLDEFLNMLGEGADTSRVSSGESGSTSSGDENKTTNADTSVSLSYYTKETKIKSVRDFDSFTVDVCNEVIALQRLYADYDKQVSECEEAEKNAKVIKTVAHYRKCFDCKKNNRKCDDCDNVADGEIFVLGDAAISVLESANDVTAKFVLEHTNDVVDNACNFKRLTMPPHITCDSGELSACKPYYSIRKDLDKLYGLLTSLGLDKDVETREQIIAKSTGIGAAVGTGAGGLATAITALVESGNINCRVGDDLARVGFNKSYSIETLKDYYVKWNLNLPDSVLPTSNPVTDYETWQRGCGLITNSTKCDNAQIYYKPSGAALTQISSACKWTGNMCGVNEIVATSRGVRDAVSGCEDWTKLCARLDTVACDSYVMYYNSLNNTMALSVENACKVQDGKCKVNMPVAKSFGACE